MQTKNYDTLFGSSPAVHSFDTGDFGICIESERESKMKQAEKRIQTIRRHLTSSGTS